MDTVVSGPLAGPRPPRYGGLSSGLLGAGWVQPQRFEEDQRGPSSRESFSVLSFMSVPRFPGAPRWACHLSFQNVKKTPDCLSDKVRTPAPGTQAVCHLLAGHWPPQPLVSEGTLHTPNLRASAHTAGKPSSHCLLGHWSRVAAWPLDAEFLKHGLRLCWSLRAQSSCPSS